MNMIVAPFRFVSAGGGGVIEYVGGKTAAIPASAATNTTVSLTDLTGGLDTAPAAGDLVVIGFATGGAGDKSIGIATAGYTEVSELFADNFDDTNLSVSYKFMGGSPDTSVDVGPTTSATEPGAVVIHVFRDVSTGVTLDVAATTAVTGGSSQPNPASITPVTAGAWIVVFGAKSSDATINAFTSGDLSNFIQQNNSQSAQLIRIAGGTAEWTSGAFDPAEFGGGNARTDSSTAAVTIALRPA